METITIQEVLKDEAGNPFKTHDGQYLCAVISENGVIKTSAVPEESLISLGLITPESHNETLPQVLSHHDEGDNSIDEGANNNDKISWTDDGTRLVLDKYSEYLPLVGPMKRFNNKKKMWLQIAEDLDTDKNLSKTAIQVENRWKTVLKRKQNACKNHRTSGSKRQKVEFEEELAKIAAIDDSLQPEVMRSAQEVIINIKETPATSGSKMHEINKNRNRRAIKLPEIFMKIHKEKEENKEKRHQEKMDFLKQFAKSIQDAEEKKG